MKWEYKVIEVGKSKGLLFQSKELKADDLNKLGNEGWELVTALSVSGSAPGFGAVSRMWWKKESAYPTL